MNITAISVILGTAAMLVPASVARAQGTASRMAVEVVAPADMAPIGQRLVWAVRQKLAASPLLYLWELTSDRDVEEIRYVLHLTPLDSDGDGLVASYSAVWTLNPGLLLVGKEVYVTSQVGSVGAKRIEAVADTLVARTYELSRDPNNGLSRFVVECMRSCFEDRLRQKSRAGEPPNVQPEHSHSRRDGVGLARLTLSAAVRIAQAKAASCDGSH